MKLSCCLCFVACVPLLFCGCSPSASAQQAPTSGDSAPASANQPASDAPADNGPANRQPAQLPPFREMEDKGDHRPLQEQAQSPSPQWRATTDTGVARTEQDLSDAYSSAYRTLNDTYGLLEQKAQSLVKRYRSAKSDSEREKIRQELVDVTTRQFDMRNEQRKQELDRLREQLKEVESKVERRLELKQQIIKRRVTELTREDAELRWDAPSNAQSYPIRNRYAAGQALPTAVPQFGPFVTIPALPSADPQYPEPAPSYSPPVGANATTNYLRRLLVVEVHPEAGGERKQTRFVYRNCEFMNPPKPSGGVQISGHGMNDNDLAVAKTVDNLTGLDLDGSLVTDQGLEQLSDHPTLESLSLRGVLISDQGLKYIARIPGLNQLALASTMVSDTGLKELHPFKSLEYLSLDNTKVTSQGVRELLGHVAVKHLSLNNTTVDDSLLEDLHFAGPLAAISLYDTNFSPRGIEALWNLQANCAIASSVVGNAQPPLVTPYTTTGTPISVGGPPFVPPPDTTPVTPAPASPSLPAPRAMATPSQDASSTGTANPAVAKVRLDNARRSLERLSALAEQGVASAGELAQAKEAYDVATIIYENAQRDWEGRRKLLQIDVQQARVELDAATVRLQEVDNVNKNQPNGIAQSELREARTVVEKAQLALDRAMTKLDLHIGTNRGEEQPAEAPASQDVAK